MKLKILIVCLATLTLGACKGQAKIEASYDIGFKESVAPPPQTIRVVVEVVGAAQPATPVPVPLAAPVSSASASAPVRQRQQFVVKPVDDCADSSMKFQVKQSVQVHD